MTWVDEEILPRLEQTIDRYPGAVMYLTGSIDIDDPEQISIQAKPQQLDTAVKQGRKLEFSQYGSVSAKTLRPHPAVASGSGSPLPILGEGLGVRARLMILH
jgi:hypothetical protein